MSATKTSGFRGSKTDKWWTKNSKYGVKYQCSSCGKITLGMYGTGNDAIMHLSTCSRRKATEVDATIAEVEQDATQIGRTDGRGNPINPDGRQAMSAADIDPVRTFWLVTVCNRELSGEPDVGLAVSLGSAADAEALGQVMVDKLAVAGYGRCTYRARELEVSRAYRASALLNRISTKLTTT